MYLEQSRVNYPSRVEAIEKSILLQPRLLSAANATDGSLSVVILFTR
jgi:hypothetical protein